MTWRAFVLFWLIAVTLDAGAAGLGVGLGEIRLLLQPSLCVTAFALLRWPPVASVLFACSVGAASDLAAAGPNGLAATSLGLAAYLTTLLRWRLALERAGDLAWASALLYLLARLTTLALLAVAGRPIGLPSLAETILLPGMVMQAAIATLGRWPLEMLWDRVGRVASHARGSDRV